MREKDGQPLAIDFKYDAQGLSARTAGAEYLASAWKDLGRRCPPAGASRGAAQRAVLRHRGMGRRLGAVHLQPALADGRVRVRTVACGRWRQLLQRRNAAYTAAAEKATRQVGEAGCADWADAEEALLSDFDLVPTLRRRLQSVPLERRADGTRRPDLGLHAPPARGLIDVLTQATATPTTAATDALPDPWLSFAVRRGLRLVVSLWVLVTFSFLIVHLSPGDPVRAALGPQTPTAVSIARGAELGLDDPLLTQYLHYLRACSTAIWARPSARLPVAQSSPSGCRTR